MKSTTVYDLGWTIQQVKDTYPPEAPPTLEMIRRGMVFLGEVEKGRFPFFGASKYPDGWDVDTEAVLLKWNGGNGIYATADLEAIRVHSNLLDGENNMKTEHTVYDLGWTAGQVMDTYPQEHMPISNEMLERGMVYLGEVEEGRFPFFGARKSSSEWVVDHDGTGAKWQGGNGVYATADLDAIRAHTNLLDGENNMSSITIGGETLEATPEQMEQIKAILEAGPVIWSVPKDWGYCVYGDNHIQHKPSWGQQVYQKTGRARASEDEAEAFSERSTKRDRLDAWITQHDPGHDMHGPGWTVWRMTSGKYETNEADLPDLYELTMSSEKIAEKLAAALNSGEVVL